MHSTSILSSLIVWFFFFTFHAYFTHDHPHIISTHCNILNGCFVELHQTHSQALLPFCQISAPRILCHHVRLDESRVQCVCAPEHVRCAGALVQDCSVPWCGLEQGSHVDTAARPICASHTVTITELLTLEASSSHIALKPLTMPHTPIPKLTVLQSRCSATSTHIHSCGLKKISLSSNFTKSPTLFYELKSCGKPEREHINQMNK